MTESGEKAKLLKCYSGESEASSYQRALYAAENKEVEMSDELEREALRCANYASAVRDIAADPTIEDKSLAFKKMAAQFYIDQKALETEAEEEEMPSLKNGEVVLSLDGGDSLVNRIKQAVMDVIGTKEKEKQGDFIIWKEKDGTLKWMARYSNKFRDDDLPPEIISEKSHERFVKLVDEGKAALPELYLWHIPELRFGKATHVAYDDSGFAMAAGVVDDTKEAKELAEWLSVQKDVSVSHGMPTSTITRDPDDNTVIIQHETVEISVLPTWAAANKMTGFVILDSETKEKSMAIPDSKFASLVESWGAKPELLRELEGRNKADAEAAEKAGIESKELEKEETAENTNTTETTEVANVDENVTAEAKAETESKEEADTSAETETAAEETESPADQEDTSQSEDILAQSPTRQEVVDFLADTIKPYLDRIGEVEKQVGGVEGKIDIVLEAVKGMILSDEEKIQKAVLDTPAASMSALLAERFSAVGKDRTSVDGRSSLAKSKPDEAPSPNAGDTGIPFIDRLKSGEDVGREYFNQR